MRELHLFAGAGGGILGGMLLGHRCVGAVEIDPFARAVLEARQRDGYLEPFPIHDDIRSFDGTKWRGAVDVVAGGFPCQDISSAGKGAGLVEGKKSSLWFEMLRVVRECEPAYVFIENSPMLRTRGLDVVLEGLASLGFDAAWDVVAASDLGAPHIRKRMWLLAAHPDRTGCQQQRWAEPTAEECVAAERGCQDVADPDRQRELQQEGVIKNVRRWAGNSGCQAVADSDSRRCKQRDTEFGEVSVAGQGRASSVGWWQAEPPVGRVVNGMANRVGQLRCLGNGQVPIVAATAFRLLRERLERQ